VLRAKESDFLVGRVEVWSLGAVWMRTPLGFHVDHPIGRVSLAKHAYSGLVGRVEGWALGAVRMRTPLVYHVDHHPIGRVGLAKHGAGSPRNSRLSIFNHNPSKTDECPPNIFKMKVNRLFVTFCKRPLDGLWLNRGFRGLGAGLVGRVEVWSLGAVLMRTPRVFHVDHPIGRVGLAKPADAGLVGRVEGWALGAVRMRTPLGFHVDHPIGRVGLAKHAYSSRRQLTPNFGRIFGPRDWATL
jgi:hypothetical protein